jgi:hypothetical protein
MGNTRNTGYLQKIVQYDASNNITLPANLTVTGSITGYATTSYVTTQINNLVNGAPGALDTLNELAAALGNDASFASTLTTSLAGKQSTLTFTGPLVNTSGTITITQSSGSTNGFLSNTDWTTFNSKQSTLTFSGPLVNTSGTISITQSSGSTNGYLSNTDWTTFNNKQAALSGTGFVKISGTTISYDNSTYLTTASATSTYLPLAGGTLTGALLFTSTAPLNFQSNSNNGTYNPTVIYFNQNNTSANTANGIFIERGRLTDSSSAEVRYFVIGARGGSIQWQVDGTGNTTQTGTLNGTNAIFSSSVTAGASSFITNSTTYNTGLSSVLTLTNNVNGNGNNQIGLSFRQIDYGNGISWYPATIAANKSFDGTYYSGELWFQVKAASTSQSTLPVTVLTLASTGAATFNSTGSFGNGTLNGAYFIIRAANNAVPATTGTTSTAVLRLSSGTGLYNVLDFGTNEASDYSWIQSTRANSLGTYDKLLLQPNGGNLAIGTTTATWKLSVANEAVIGAQGGSDYTYISGGSGYGSVIRSYYATGAINNEIRGNGNNYFNVLLGSMGVGTNNPQYTLDVNGSGRFVGNLYANNKLYTTTVIGANLVAGNISSNMPSAPAYILIVDLNNIAGFSLSGKVNAASYTCWNISDIWIQKNYSSTTASAGIEGKYKSGCDFSIVNINYGAGNYIALRFTSNPEIDVLWTGFRLTDQVSGGAFQVITSGVTVNSTYATY